MDKIEIRTINHKPEKFLSLYSLMQCPLFCYPHYFNTGNILRVFKDTLGENQQHASHPCTVSRVHGSHWLGHSRRVAHAAVVYRTHTEEVGTTLHQAGNGETSKLHRCVIALDPVVGSNLTSACVGKKNSSASDLIPSSSRQLWEFLLDRLTGPQNIPKSSFHHQRLAASRWR